MVSHLTRVLCVQLWHEPVCCPAGVTACGGCAPGDATKWDTWPQPTLCIRVLFPSAFFPTKNHRNVSFFPYGWFEFFFPSCLQTKLANGTSSMIVPKQRKLSASYEKEKELCVKYFEQWSESDQVEFVEHLISQMCHYQHGHINSYLKPMLQRDFITALPGISAGRGSLLLHLGFQETILLSPTLLERSIPELVCETEDTFWKKSSILVWNVVIFYFVFLLSLKAWSN